MPESVVNVVVVIAELVDFIVIVGAVIVVVNNCSGLFKEAIATDKLHYYAFKD